jgi:hypothetical protein
METAELARAETDAAAIQENFERIEAPQSETLQALLELWKTRPQDGFEIGRDIPSRAFAPFLSHILLWEPMEGTTDYRLHLCGESLRLRFGNNPVGKSFSQLVAPEAVPHFLEAIKSVLAKDLYSCFNIHLSRSAPIDGRRQLDFELLTFPVWSPRRTARWILNGVHYFL